MTSLRTRFAKEVTAMRVFQGWTIANVLMVLPRGWTAAQLEAIENERVLPPPKIRRVLLAALGSSWGDGCGRRRKLLLPPMQASAAEPIAHEVVTRPIAAALEFLQWAAPIMGNLTDAKDLGSAVSAVGLVKRRLEAILDRHGDELMVLAMTRGKRGRAATAFFKVEAAIDTVVVGLRRQGEAS